MSVNLILQNGVVYGNRITIDIDSANYKELIQEIISKAKNLKIKTNYTYPTEIDYNITSLTIEGSYEDRESFFLKIEKIHKIKIKIKRDLLK